MTNITKDELDELINQVKATDYKPYIPILTRNMIEKYKEYISHLGNIRILIQKKGIKNGNNNI